MIILSLGSESPAEDDDDGIEESAAKNRLSSMPIHKHIEVSTIDSYDDLTLSQISNSTFHILDPSKQRIDNEIFSRMSSWLGKSMQLTSYNQIGLIQDPRRSDEFVQRIHDASHQEKLSKRLEELRTAVKHPYKATIVRG